LIALIAARKHILTRPYWQRYQLHGGSVERIKGGILRPHGNRVQRTNGNRTMN